MISFRIEVDGDCADVHHEFSGALLGYILVDHVPLMIAELENLPIDWATATAATIQDHKSSVMPILIAYGNYKHSDIIGGARGRLTFTNKLKARLRAAGVDYLAVARVLKTRP